MVKKMSCHQLGGACDHVFEAETFEELARLSQAHTKEMMDKNDAAHLAKVQEMRELMKNPDAMNAWMEEKKAFFAAL